MTRTAFFSGSVHLNTAAGKRAASGTFAASFLGKAIGVLMAPITAGDVAQPNVWMTANIRSNMSPRAQRLMRAGY